MLCACGEGKGVWGRRMLCACGEGEECVGEEEGAGLEQLWPEDWREGRGKTELCKINISF